jgi:polyisoprenoid-binding protein YceI
MKKILIALIVIILIGAGAYAYIVRPVAAPTEDVQSVTDTLKPFDNTATTLYRLTDGTTAEFQMNELLYKRPKLVVGTTTEVAGDIAITGDHIQMGEFKLDARTLTTDSSQRNGAINRVILKTGTPGNEYVTFKPQTNDFTGKIEEGKPVAFNVNGNLTVSGVTKPVTFKVTMTVNGDTLTGKGETRIKRSDFGITIPNLSFLANIDDEFPIFIDVVAKKVAQ